MCNFELQSVTNQTNKFGVLNGILLVLILRIHEYEDVFQVKSYSYYLLLDTKHESVFKRILTLTYRRQNPKSGPT